MPEAAARRAAVLPNADPPRLLPPARFVPRLQPVAVAAPPTPTDRRQTALWMGLALLLPLGWWFASLVDSGAPSPATGGAIGLTEPIVNRLNAPAPVLSGRTLNDPELAAALVAKKPLERTLSMVRLVTAANASQCANWLQQLAVSRHPEAASAGEYVLGRLLEIDPAAGVRAVQATTDANLHESWLHTLLFQWAQTDPDEALKGLIQFSGRDLDLATTAFLAARYLSGDNVGDWQRRLPGGFNAEAWNDWLTTNMAGADPQGAFVAALNQHDRKGAKLATDLWARRDPVSAVNAARQVPHEELRDELMLTALLRWAERDSDAAWEYVLGFPPPNDHLRAVVLTALLDRNPAQALTLAKANSNSDFQRTVQAWVERHPLEVLSQLDAIDLNGTERDEVQLSALAALAATDPDLALARAKLIRPELRDDFLAAQAANFGAAEFDRAMAWIGNIDDADKRQSGLTSVLEAAAQSRPNEVAAFLSEVKDRNAIAQIAGDVAYGMAISDPTAALLWAESLHAPDARANAVSRAAGQLAERDPSRAIEQLLAMDESARRAAMNDVLLNVAASDPDLAINAVNDLHDDRNYRSALVALVTGLATSAPDRAAAQVDGLTPDELGNVDIQVVSSALMTSDQDGAADWLANTLRRPVTGPHSNDFQESADFAVAQMIYDWHGDDAALQAWMRTLPDDYRAHATTTWLASERASFADVQQGLAAVPTGEQRREVAESAVSRFTDVSVDTLHDLLANAGFSESEARSMLASRQH